MSRCVVYMSASDTWIVDNAQVALEHAMSSIVIECEQRLSSSEAMNVDAAKVDATKVDATKVDVLFNERL